MKTKRNAFVITATITILLLTTTSVLATRCHRHPGEQ